MALKPMVIFVDDGSGFGSGLPVDPSFGVPAPGARPDQGLPSRPGAPARPDQGLPPIPVHKPAPPAAGAKPSPMPVLPTGAFIVCWAPGHGWVAVPVDPNAPGVDNTLPGGAPPHASGQPVPPGTAPTPTPQGRR